MGETSDTLADLDTMLSGPATPTAEVTKKTSAIKTEPTVNAVAKTETSVKLSPEQARISESRKALVHPLSPGQAFFEAPDGYVMVGEADKPHIWYRQGNNGKGMWINPRRETTPRG